MSLLPEIIRVVVTLNVVNIKDSVSMVNVNVVEVGQDLTEFMTQLQANIVQIIATKNVHFWVLVYRKLSVSYKPLCFMIHADSSFKYILPPNILVTQHARKRMMMYQHAIQNALKVTVNV